MKERSIQLRAHEVRGIRDGRQSQFRRIVKPQPTGGHDRCVLMPASTEVHFVNDETGEGFPHGADSTWLRCPYGKPGENLWVKETSAMDCGDGRILYRADGDDVSASLDGKWIPSLFMRRENSRITLEITGVRCERLQAISEADCYAEAIPKPTAGLSAELTRPSARMQFQILWESIHGPGSWALNPWLWVIGFRKL